MRMYRSSGRGFGKAAGFLIGLLFEVHGGEETESAVEPLAVVKDLDVLEDGEARFGLGGEGAAGQQLGCEGAPEALSRLLQTPRLHITCHFGMNAPKQAVA